MESRTSLSAVCALSFWKPANSWGAVSYTHLDGDKRQGKAKPLFDLAQSINGFRPVAGNRIVLLGDPAAPPSEPKADSNASIEVLIADIEQARDHVHIGFYIWLDDHNGGHVTDAVCAAARLSLIHI